MLAGNHDVDPGTDDQRGDTPYLRAFGPARFAHSATFGGASPDGYNSYHVFRAAGRRWLLLALDWRPSTAGLAWAQSVLDAHPRLPVILTTHEIAFADDAGEAHLSEFGRHLWDQLIARNDQVFLTWAGTSGRPDAPSWPTPRAMTSTCTSRTTRTVTTAVRR